MIPTRDSRSRLETSYNKTCIVNNDSRERLTTFIYEEKYFSLQALNVVLAHDSNTGFQHAIGNSNNKTCIVNNDSRERLTTFIYEEKYFSLQGLNVVLAHDSNARFALAIGNLGEQNA